MVSELELMSFAGGLYLAEEDHLRLRVLNGLAGVTVRFEGRVLRSDGAVVVVVEDLVPATDRTASTKLIQVDRGVVLNFSVRPLAGAPRRGQCWCVVELVRGYTGDVLSLGALAKGYLTETDRLLWPWTSYGDSADGPGCIRSVTGTDPAAGVETSETVPTNARWRLKEWRASLVTDGTVANRTVQLVIDDGTTTLHLIPAHANQTASLTWNYHGFHLGQSGFAAGTFIGLPLAPDLVLMGGYRIRTSTTTFQAGDNWGAPQLLVEEWIED